MWSREEELEDLYDGRSELLQPIRTALFSIPRLSKIEWRGSDRLQCWSKEGSVRYIDELVVVS